MRALLVTLLLAASAAAQLPKPAPRPSELPITHVALYKNGVGFFEHAGRVTGDQSVTIDFTSAQLNDVLQSLTAIDLNGGRISGAGYNSTTPLDQQLKTLPLALSANPTEADFYNAIRGARVQVSVGPLASVGAKPLASGTLITGRLLSITAQPADSLGEHRFVTVVSESGQVRTLELTPNVTVTLLDTELHTDVTRYLELLASTRNQGLRHLTLLDRGTGTRDLRVSYISEVPVWKSTYRILFTDVAQQANPTATLQGWSVVDNTTGTDWLNVHIDLIAGAPQSFIQPLSIPYYSRRPEIAIPGEAQLSPQTHDSGDLPGGHQPTLQGVVTDPTGAVIPNARIAVTDPATGNITARNTDAQGRYSVPLARPGQYTVDISMPGFNTQRQTNLYIGDEQATNLNPRLTVGAATQTVSVTADAPMLQTESASVGSVIDNRNIASLARLRKGVVGSGSAGGVMGGYGYAPPPPPVDYAEAAQASIAPQTTTSAFDDFFQYSITDPITILKNESALVPILQARLPIERVTLWSAREPIALRALWLTNSSTLTLDRGSFSIVENGSFGGEGLLDPIHPGERRLLSYAADQAVHVDLQPGPQQQHLRSVVIAKGILTSQYRDTVERDYNIRNAAPEPRTVVIEHTRTPGYELTPDAPKPDETLASTYRYRIVVAPNSTAHLKVAESHAYPRTIQVGSINDQQIRLLIQQMGRTSAENASLMQKLQPVLDAQRAVADLNAKKQALDTQLENLNTEEERQRANIVALKDTDKASQKRFVDQLGKIEDQILSLQKQQETLETQLDAAEQDLAAKVYAVQFTQTLEP